MNFKKLGDASAHPLLAVGPPDTTAQGLSNPTRTKPNVKTLLVSVIV